MKVKINRSDATLYPCLKIHENGITVVLFTNAGIGTVIQASPSGHMGFHRKDWDEKTFEYFTGTVTLSQ